MTEPTDLKEPLRRIWREIREADTRQPVRRRRGERALICVHIRTLVKLRDGFCCRICPETKGLHVDHIHPWSAGGSDYSYNLQALCVKHNEEKSNYAQVGWELRPPIVMACHECREVTHPERLIRVWCLSCRRTTSGAADEARGFAGWCAGHCDQLFADGTARDDLIEGFIESYRQRRYHRPYNFVREPANVTTVAPWVEVLKNLPPA